MEKTISANELKSDPEAVLREVSAGDEVVIVESPEAPTAAIISLDEYRRLREVEDQQRRQQAFAELERLRLEIDQNLSDLSDDERRALAEEISNDVMDRILANGQFRFVDP
jgi:prevent-host-death family protein